MSSSLRLAAFTVLSLLAHLGAAAALRVGAMDPQPESPSSSLLGDTFAETEIDTRDEVETDTSGAPEPTTADAPRAETPTPTPSSSDEPAPASRKATPRPPAPGAARDAARSRDGALVKSGSSSNAGAGSFGAVGVPGASDLATAFVRGFPQVASVDAAWGRAPLGVRPAVDVELELDDEGRIVAFHAPNASAPLSQSIQRTFGLLKGRRFTAKGARTRLRLTCTVSADTVHDGLHGEVFAIGGSFQGGQGNAFFALATGRRIDVDVQQR